MATNKNQHFVPRCYLRPFTSEEGNSAINLYNLDRSRFIERAPVKNQCSGDYFYGQDRKLEVAIQTVESAYAGILREILKPGCQLVKEYHDVLRIFWLFQNLRTEAASRRAVEMAGDTAEVMGEEGNNFRLNIKDAVQLAMSAFADSMNVVMDLKVCLIKNITNVPFVTSDDPAVLTNRWYLDSPKTRGMSFGMRDAGALLLLPLSPKIFCICYDSDVYSIASENGWLSVRNKSDIQALNEFQILYCRANLFLKDERYAGQLHEAVVKVKARRIENRHSVNYAVFDGVEAGVHRRYKVVDKETFISYPDGLMHFQTVHPRPSTWPSFLRRKSKGVAYYNGTGVGYVRKAHVEVRSDLPFAKIRAY
ncbi:DUF4238 domain-containing protein [Stutzerimonas nitrititolerans]|uniref:DUF4238 domain-containing protein n=1 Tax=Stutzerimonas nitrititolerans TaxID=2482751 RepID=UPI0028A8BE23|nr:DUF4238 domain-containing protein [Stutzerimonas nitrititolerans]